MRALAILVALALTPSIDTLAIGEQVQLVAAAMSSSGTAIQNKMFTWSSSNDAIASVNTGLVTAHASGTVVIAANTDNVVGITSIVVMPQS